MILDSRVEQSLTRLSLLLRHANEPWWIIGSVAVALHGGEPGMIADIDVLLGHADAERCFRELGLRNLAPTGNPLFRSDLFAHWTDTPVRIELMAGLKVRSGVAWKPVSVQSRDRVREALFVPSRNELRDMLLLFGRKKDLERAATLA